MPKDPMPAGTVTVGEAVARVLEAHGVTDAFGVISIHNMPVLDAFARRGRIRFIPARGEAGASNMADAATRVTGRTAVCVTSTGTGAGNAAGALVEAQTAGTPMLHLTGQIDRAYLDRGWGFIHEAADQPGLLRAVSKAFFRVSRPEEAVPVLRRALQVAHAAPTGPVSVEIPIDVQKAAVAADRPAGPLPVAPVPPDPAALDRLIEALGRARRPLLWLGGGARGAAAPARRLADAGIGIVTSVAGRGVVDEAHPMSLGAFTIAPSVEDLYREADLMVVVGSHLRSNETRTYVTPLPADLVRVDVDAAADGRGYPGSDFVQGDAVAVLARLAEHVDALSIDPAWAGAVEAAKAAAEAKLAADAGPYAALIDAVGAALPAEAAWVRDVTLSNSIWGNRRPLLDRPGRGVHALGGGIGQGVAMGAGAAIAAGRPALALVGDGGFMLNPVELMTAREAGASLVVLLMNDGGYGVIRNIQDAHYGGRYGYTDLANPGFADLARAFGIGHRRIAALAEAEPALRRAFAAGGVQLVEVDMPAIGDFAIHFAGPPAKGA